MSRRVFRQDTLYNPAEQGQVGQLSNRYIVISRLIRYESLFIFTQRGCVTICGTKSSLSYHTLLPCTGKSCEDLRRESIFMSAHLESRIGPAIYINNVVVFTASREKSSR